MVQKQQSGTRQLEVLMANLLASQLGIPSQTILQGSSKIKKATKNAISAQAAQQPSKASKKKKNKKNKKQKDRRGTANIGLQIDFTGSGDAFKEFDHWCDVMTQVFVKGSNNFVTICPFDLESVGYNTMTAQPVTPFVAYNHFTPQSGTISAAPTSSAWFAFDRSTISLCSDGAAVRQTEYASTQADATTVTIGVGSVKQVHSPYSVSSFSAATGGYGAANGASLLHLVRFKCTKPRLYLGGDALIWTQQDFGQSSDGLTTSEMVSSMANTMRVSIDDDWHCAAFQGSWSPNPESSPIYSAGIFWTGAQTDQQYPFSVELYNFGIGMGPGFIGNQCRWEKNIELGAAFVRTLTMHPQLLLCTPQTARNQVAAFRRAVLYECQK
jgi:hypothetical protein